MTSYIQFLVLGIGAGAIYAGLALGLVVQFKASGVVNFSFGAIAMLGAYMYNGLRQSGELVLPWIGVPYRFHIATRVPAVPAALIALAVTGVVGLAIYRLILWPLRDAPSLAKVVATVGLMLAIQALVVIQYGTQSILPTTVLPNRPLSVFGLDVPEDRFYLAGLIVLIAAGLWAVFRFSRFGLSTIAMAESERGAVVTGISPVYVGAVNWVGTSVLAALVGILIAPITSLDPSIFPLYIVPALAAALLGRLNSLGVTAAGGLALGMAQSEITFLSAKSWFPSWASGGAPNAIPFVVIIITLFIVGRGLPGRGDLPSLRTMRSLRQRGSFTTTGIWLAGSLVLLLVLHHGYRFAVIVSLIGVILMLSIVVITGFLGQISLAQATFAGAGGFLISRIAQGAHIPFPLAPLVAAGCAALVGALASIPALRVRGIQLAVVSLAAAVAVEQVLFDNPAISGGLGGSKVPAPRVFGIDLGPYSGGAFPSVTFGIVCLVVVALSAAMVLNIRRSGLGRRMLAVRSNEQAAAASGINVVAVKIGGFLLASFLAGFAGAMTGYLDSRLSASSFTAFVSIQLLAVAYLGGISTVGGAFIGGSLVAGGLLATFANQTLNLGQYYLLFSGLGVTITAVLNPEGMAHGWAPMVGLVARCRPYRDSRSVPDLTPSG